MDLIKILWIFLTVLFVSEFFFNICNLLRKFWRKSHVRQGKESNRDKITVTIENNKIESLRIKMVRRKNRNVFEKQTSKCRVEKLAFHEASCVDSFITSNPCT